MAGYYPKTGVCYEHRERSKIYMIYTFTCNASCDHCLVESNPRKKEKLELDVAKEILRLGARYGKSFLDLSGGEIMLFPEEVHEIARTARDLGYYICMNTNSYWAHTPERAYRAVKDLKEAGVNAIFPSASAYHMKYVPLERVKNARQACRELGVAYELNWMYSHQPEVDEKIQADMGLDRETLFFDGLTTRGNDLVTIDSLKKTFKTRTPDELDDCLSVHMGVNPHGHVVTTCNMTYLNEKFQNTPFFLGNCREQPFEEILQAEQRSSVLQYIYDNPHPSLHRLLSEDEEIGDHYRATVSRRGYYGIIDYYLDLFYDEQIMAWLDRTLPEHLAAAQ
jgi:MoaA/NifB/PqqE/SkfB family radical SAM enzyme